MSKGPKPRSMRERFADMWTPEPNTGCWLWLGAPHGFGYGRIAPDGSARTIGAHRASYELHVGPIPQGLFVLHRCDQPACVNPSHLFLGTHADNMRDKALKGRGQRLRGEACGRARLTWAVVQAARESEKTCADLARQYGVHFSTMSNALHGVTWRTPASQEQGAPRQHAVRAELFIQPKEQP